MKVNSPVTLLVVQISCLSLMLVLGASVSGQTSSLASGQAVGGVRAGAQNPLAALDNEAKEKAAEAALTKVLNDNLPLVLNAKDVYPTVATLPGGPFSPTPLKLTADQLDQPLPPGDYTINTLDFCSQYSIHQPGAGLAYVLGPYQGKAADAIGDLIWRGTEQYQINPNSLQAVSWAIQSGLTYGQMPRSYQAIIDEVIPDQKSEITGDFVTNLENTYNSLAKAASLPPLDTILAKLGQPGQLALDAEKERQILTAQNTSDELKQQTLFQGQESGIFTPVKAESGPWTERIQNQVYMKLLIAGGNMNTNNIMQIRVLPPPTANARVQSHGPHMVRAAYAAPQVVPGTAGPLISLATIMEGILGYSQGQGAQALGQVAVVTYGPPVPPPAVKAGTVKSAAGTLSVIRAGTTTTVPLNPGDTVDEGDTIVTGADGNALVVFEDNTQITLGENTKILIDSYVYDPSDPDAGTATLRVMEGVFRYISGLIGAKDPGAINIDTPVDGIGRRGTELIGKVDAAAMTLEIDLIEGAVALTPKGSTIAGPAMTGPIQIEVSSQGARALPMTRDQYNAIKTQSFAAVAPAS
jgi:hypothetical protein